jgi:hypothetical protein
MSEPRPPSRAASLLAAELGAEPRRIEITIRLAVMVLLGLFVAALGAWEAWRVLTDVG